MSIVHNNDGKVFIVHSDEGRVSIVTMTRVGYLL